MTPAMNLNLLPSSAKFQAAKIRLQYQVKLVTIWMVAAWLIVGAVVMSLNLYTKFMLDQASAEYDKVLTNYKSMTDDIVTSQNLKYKAKMVGTILSKRFEYGKSFELIQSLFSEGIILRDYDLKEEGQFVLTGTVQTRQGVDQLEKTIKDINSGLNDKLISARLNNLALKGGVWSFTMEVVLK